MKTNDDNMLQLIKLYCYVSDVYDSTLYIEVQRFSHNAYPKFTDTEAMTTYLWGLKQGHTTVKAIHCYISTHYADCFPNLPGYQEYVRRINLLSPAFTALSEILMENGRNLDIIENDSLLDSFPVVLANGKRKKQAKVARECCSEGYCASKDMYYYGAKVHIIGFRREGTLPVPEYIHLTEASVHDLTALRPVLEQLENRTLYGDKAYADQALSAKLQANSTLLLTPVKKRKGQTGWEDQFFGAANRLWSSAVSRVRLPIESLFSWINRKVALQDASFVRSASGLMTFIFGKLAFCLLAILGIL